MESDSLKSTSTDELWCLHKRVISALHRRIPEEKAKLEERLRLLEKSSRAIGPNNRPRGA